VPIQTKYDSKTQTLLCQGAWNIAHLPEIKIFLEETSWPTHGQLIIDGKDITAMDSAGAWLLNSWIKKHEKTLQIHLQHFSSHHQTLLSLVEKKRFDETEMPQLKILPWLARLGKESWEQLIELQQYLHFIGKLTFDAIRVTLNPKHFRFNEIMGIINKTGYQALFIIALLSFMIGVVVAYQMGLQLKNYGANVFIVDLLGLSVLREFGPLITAIMVAGRTGSAFTAQLGIMKINQEIDALNTMGVTPGELLILPRIAGLFIALPLLTIWADIFGVAGGMMMANNMLDITWDDFLERFQREIPLRSLLIGIGKAPVFALIIASIGCFQGIQVQGNAESIGKNTTRSVVLGIFFIIVADAIFSVLFSKLKL
jgi:phospholipid/cholesterol/gamma-HCH transport system permease protein